MTLRCGTLFSGIGSGDRGLELAGFECAWQVEIDPTCQRVLVRHWPDVPRWTDICTVQPADLSPVDVVLFGSPCQDLSVAGKRAGLGGERSGLFYEAIRLVRAIRPAFVAWENVPGALSSHRGRDFAAVLDALAECGALDIAWRILDAQHFGVPQRRRRLFVVADFRGERAAQVLFEPESGHGHSAACQQARQDVAGSTPSGTNGARRPEVTPTLSSNGDAHSGLRDDGGLVVARALTAHGQRLDSETETFITHALTSQHGCTEDGTGRGTPQVASLGTDASEDGTGRGVPLAVLDVHPCLAAQMGGPASQDCDARAAVISGASVRRLTPVECARLQGLPDDWLTGESDSAQYRMLGNAMAVPVITWLGHRLMEAIA